MYCYCRIACEAFVTARCCIVSSLAQIAVPIMSRIGYQPGLGHMPFCAVLMRTVSHCFWQRQLAAVLALVLRPHCTDCFPSAHQRLGRRDAAVPQCGRRLCLGCHAQHCWCHLPARVLSSRCCCSSGWGAQEPPVVDFLNFDCGLRCTCIAMLICCGCCAASYPAIAMCLGCISVCAWCASVVL